MKVIFLVAVFTIVYIVGLDVTQRYLDRWEYEDTTNQEVSINNEDSLISVQIRGEVVNPGIYNLDESSLLIDLINAAGGVLDNADRHSYRENLVIEEGNSYYISKINVDENNMNTKVSLNSASKDLLITLPGIGDIYSSRIIEYRDINGSFKYIEEIQKISGIGEAIFENLKDKITL